MGRNASVGYVKGFFQNIPALAALVQRETIDGFEPTNGGHPDRRHGLPDGA